MDTVPGEAFQVGDFCADVEVEIALVVFSAVDEPGCFVSSVFVE